jgi:hypothetical protein
MYHDHGGEVKLVNAKCPQVRFVRHLQSIHDEYLTSTHDEYPASTPDKYLTSTYDKHLASNHDRSGTRIATSVRYISGPSQTMQCSNQPYSRMGAGGILEMCKSRGDQTRLSNFTGSINSTIGTITNQKKKHN